MFSVKVRTIILAIIFCLGVSSVVCAQQPSSDSSQGGSSPSKEIPTGGAPDPVADAPELPAIPGANFRILKDGEKVPERAHPDYEDWSHPQLDAHMKMEVSHLAKTESAGVIRELVSVQWREMDPIDLWIIRPSDVKKPPAILYLYSYPSNNDRYRDAEFCKFLTRNGFAAIGFVSAINGERVHDRARRDWFVSQLQEGLGASVHDVQMILNYLAARGDLDMERVGMWADGSGAAIAIMASAVDSRIKVLDLLNPWGDWPEWLAQTPLISDEKRPGYVRPEFLQTVQDLDPVKWFPKVKAQQVRLQIVDSGIKVTPDSVRQKIEAAAPRGAEIVHYDSSKAFLTNVASTGKGFDWIKERLSPSANLQLSGDLTKANRTGESSSSVR